MQAASKDLADASVTRIVVFVDDLDGCLPTNALDVLESMKLFFDLPGFIFVVGLDESVIDRAGLMREQGLAARRRKRRKGTTRPGRGRWRAEDLVRRKFAAGGINRRWYGDGTEIKTAEGKLYLDSVLDMGSRRILGHALGEHHDAALAYGALAMAVAVRGRAGAGWAVVADSAWVEEWVADGAGGRAGAGRGRYSGLPARTPDDRPFCCSGAVTALWVPHPSEK